MFPSARSSTTLRDLTRSGKSLTIFKFFFLFFVVGAHDVTRCSFFLGGTRVEVVKKGVQMNETRWRQLGRRDEKKQKKKGTPLDVLREAKMDSPIHTNDIHSGATLIFIV